MKLNKHLESAQLFIRELARELGDEQDTDRATRVLRAVFDGLRERLTLEESFNLLSTFPLFIKGMYVDGWRPTVRAEKVKSLDEFIELVRLSDGPARERDFSGSDQSLHTLLKTFHVLKNHTSLGETLDIGATLPAELRDFWLSA